MTMATVMIMGTIITIPPIPMRTIRLGRSR